MKLTYILVLVSALIASALGQRASDCDCSIKKQYGFCEAACNFEAQWGYPMPESGDRR